MDKDLLEQLIEKQGSLSDRAFARKLGISQALWSNTKQRKVIIGQKIVRAALKEYPSLTDAVLRHYQQTPAVAVSA